MIFTAMPLPFALLVTVFASQTTGQPLLFPTRDVIVEIKNEEPGKPQEWLFSAKERKERINQKGEKTRYTIMDYDQNLMIEVNLGHPPTYDVIMLPEKWKHIHYVKTGANKQIAGLKCMGWQGEEMIDDNGKSPRETLCITDDGVILQVVTDRLYNGQHTRSIQQAIKVVYGPLDPLQFKIPTGAIRR